MTKWYSDKERFRALWEQKNPDGTYVYTARAIGEILGAPNLNVVHAHARIANFSRRLTRKSRALSPHITSALSPQSLPEGLNTMSPDEAFIAIWNHYPESSRRFLHLGRHFGMSCNDISLKAASLKLR